MKVVKVKVSDIKEYEGNSRLNEKAVDELISDIETYGFNNPILLDRDGVIIAGHARFLACKKMGLKKVDCIYLDMDDDKAKEFRILDNKIQELSGWDDEKLAIEIRGGMNSDSCIDGFGKGVERAVSKLRGDKRTVQRKLLKKRLRRKLEGLQA